MKEAKTEQDDNPFRAPQVVNDRADLFSNASLPWRLFCYAVVTVVGAVSFYACCGATCMVGASLMGGNSAAAPVGLVLMLGSIPLALVVALWLSRRLWKRMVGQ